MRARATVRDASRDASRNRERGVFVTRSGRFRFHAFPIDRSRTRNRPSVFADARDGAHSSKTMETPACTEITSRLLFSAMLWDRRLWSWSSSARTRRFDARADPDPSDPSRPSGPRESRRTRASDARRTPPEVLPPSFASPRRLKTVLLGRRRRLMPRRSAPRAFAGAASPDPTPVSPGTALVRERHDREIDDAFNKALLARSESYGSLARRLPNAVPSDRPARRSTPNAPSLPDLEPLDTNPTQLPGAAAAANDDANDDANADVAADAAAYARGRAAAAPPSPSTPTPSRRGTTRRGVRVRRSPRTFATPPTTTSPRSVSKTPPPRWSATFARRSRWATRILTPRTPPRGPPSNRSLRRNETSPAFDVARTRTGGGRGRGGVRGDRPRRDAVFLESPKMAAFDNFVDDEGALRDVSAAPRRRGRFRRGSRRFRRGSRKRKRRGGGRRAKKRKRRGGGGRERGGREEAEERRPILDGAAWRAYGSAAGAAGTRPRMDGGIATRENGTKTTTKTRRRWAWTTRRRAWTTTQRWTRTSQIPTVQVPTIRIPRRNRGGARAAGCCVARRGGTCRARRRVPRARRNRWRRRRRRRRARRVPFIHRPRPRSDSGRRRSRSSVVGARRCSNSRGHTAVSVSQVRGETSRARGVARIRGGDRPFEFQICRKRRFESLGGECLEDALGTSRAGGGD